MTDLPRSGGYKHIHRVHMTSKMGNVLCGSLTTTKKIGLTKNPEQVNCALCLKKMAKQNK